MGMAELSPSSVLASPIQVNPQVRTDLQASTPQLAQDAQKTAKTAQTDTITISAQALKMADDKNASAEAAADKSEEQKADDEARDKSAAEQSTVQRSAVKAYTAASVSQ